MLLLCYGIVRGHDVQFGDPKVNRQKKFYSFVEKFRFRIWISSKNFLKKSRMNLKAIHIHNTRHKSYIVNLGAPRHHCLIQDDLHRSTGSAPRVHNGWIIFCSLHGQPFPKKNDSKVWWTKHEKFQSQQHR